MIFSLDALLASFLLFCMFFLFLQFSADFPGVSLAEEKAVFLADSLVKNRLEENPLLGSAVFDSAKKRVLENSIDLALLEKAVPQCFGSACAKKLYLRGGIDLEIFSLDLEKNNENCVSVERLVFVGGKKALLGVVVCDSFP